MQDLVRPGTAPTGTDAIGSSGSTHDSHPSRGEVPLLATLMARVDDRIVSRGASNGRRHILSRRCGCSRHHPQADRPLAEVEYEETRDTLLRHSKRP